MNIPAKISTIAGKLEQSSPESFKGCAQNYWVLNSKIFEEKYSTLDKEVCIGDQTKRNGNSLI